MWVPTYQRTDVVCMCMIMQLSKAKGTKENEYTYSVYREPVTRRCVEYYEMTGTETSEGMRGKCNSDIGLNEVSVAETIGKPETSQQ